MAMLKTKELMQKFHIGSEGTILALFACKGSPAIKVGNKWMCDEDKFEKYLLERSEQFKS